LEAFKDAPFQWDVGLPPVRKGKQVVEFATRTGRRKLAKGTNAGDLLVGDAPVNSDAGLGKGRVR
jgi:hypothetical protein